MNKQTIKKFVARVLAWLMLFQMLPTNMISVLAEDITSQVSEQESAPAAAPAEEGTVASNVSAGGAYATVTFADEKGEAIGEPLIVEKGASVSALPAPEAKEDYTFLGWKNGDAELAPDAAIEGDMTLVANYVYDYPARSFDGEANGVSVHIEAPEGALHRDAEFAISEVDAESVRAAFESATNSVSGTLKAVDIGFKNAETGEEMQPRSAVSVWLNANGLDTTKSLYVVHIADGGEADVVARREARKESNLRSTKSGSLGSATFSFDADSFSIYIVGEDDGEVPRIRLDFVTGSGANAKTTTIYLKKSDAADKETVLYDPGVGELASGIIFEGWTENADYVGDETSMTIEDLRTYFYGGSFNWDEIVDVESAEEGIKVHKTYYPKLIKQYTIDYLDEVDASLGTNVLNLRADAAADTLMPYTVSMAYSPMDSEHDFQGWTVKTGGSNIVGYDSSDNDGKGTIYTNNTPINVKGDVTFKVYAPEGHWLVFNENGRGATYVAPQFILTGDKPTAPNVTMQRLGYTFDGWYYFPEGATIPAADDRGMIDLANARAFDFNSEITATTNIYAKWTANATANYLIVFWGQELNGDQVTDSYYVLDSLVVENAQVGSTIEYTVHENNAEDYVTIPNHNNGHYTGYGLIDADKNLQITVNPEGDTVLNLHYNRIHYNFKFYLYRDAGNNQYDYANNSGTGSDLNGLVTWHSNQDAHPSVDGYTIQSESSGGRTYHFFTLQAYYDEDISGKWPTYDKITGANGRQAVSYVMMVGTKLKPNPTDQGSGTVKGLITVMNENILGKTEDPDGNYVIVRFPNSYYNWRYHIWFETVEGEDYTGKTTRTYNGKTYYEETVLTVRSSNTTDANQNEPKYTGFDYITRLGQNNAGTRFEGGHWTTTEGGTTLYHLNYIYNRQSFRILYQDSKYVSGNGDTLFTQKDTTLHESELIGFGTPIPDQYKNFEPDNPKHDGFLFEGWYLDEGCTTPYTFTTMPLDGITVYAKWRQIQYRVFLYGNDPAEGVDWGGQSAWNFRKAFGDKVSLPDGYHPNYTLVGWYTDDKYKNVFNDEIVTLNDSTVTKDYTEKLDEDTNRWWITKRLDLYARWRVKVVGSDGILVHYDLTDPDIKNDGSNIPGTGSGTAVDNGLYVDDATAYAVPAVKGFTKEDVEYVFDHWVLQKWSNGEYVDVPKSDPYYKVYPGAEYKVWVEYAKQEFLGYKMVDEHYVDAQGHLLPDDAPDSDKVPEYKYTIQLRAEYKQKEKETPTFIAWFDNDTHKAFRVDHASGHDDYRNSTLKINEAVPIEGPRGSDDYEFIGWAIVDIGDTLEEADAFMTNGSWATSATPTLYYNEEDGKYHKGSLTGSVADKVAADENTPYQAMFAIKRIKPSLTVKKTVKVPDGFTPDTNREFEFQVVLSKAPSPPMPTTPGVTQEQGGKVLKFKLKHDQSFTIPHLHKETTYQVTEVPDSVPAYYVVKVPDNASGTMQDANITTVFENEYSATPATTTVTVTKVVTGEGFSTKTFSFTLTDKEGNPTTATVEASTTGSYTIDFGTITYSEPGTYTYTITEAAAGTGWTTTGNDATVTVKVTDNGEGSLVAEVTGGTIENSYEPEGTVINPTETSTTFGKKNLLKTTANKSQEFSFTLTPVSGTAPDGETAIEVPMPDNATVKLTYKAGEIGTKPIPFGEITYENAGTFVYEITEEAGSDWEVKNNGATVTVKVTDNGEGALVATVTEADTIENTLKQATLTIIYLYADGSPTGLPNFVKTTDVPWDYRVTSPRIPGYRPNIEAVIGTLTEDYTVRVYYDLVPYRLTIHYVYSGGGTAAPDYTDTLYYQDRYDVTSPVIPGYVASQLVVSGRMPARDVTITVYYVPYGNLVTIEDLETPLGLSNINLNTGEAIE